MAKYLNKETFLHSMGLLGDETKYGNRDGEHQNRSYSTWMGYEIMGSVEDSVVEEDVVEVVRCKDCKHFTNSHIDRGGCELEREAHGTSAVWYISDFCSYGERREGE